MKSTFDLDISTGLRTATLVFEKDNGESFKVKAKAGESASEALQCYISNKTQQACEVQIIEDGKIYKVTFCDGTTKTFSAII